MLHNETQSSKQILISYSRTNQKACIALRSALEQAGFSIFQDEDAIGIDERWVGAEVEVALVRNLSPHDDTERLPIFPILLIGAKPQ